MKIEYMGLTIEIENDGDGFPIISINTGGNYLDTHDHPAIEISVNGNIIHEMFDG
jgi:hypothetical protein